METADAWQLFTDAMFPVVDGEELRAVRGAARRLEVEVLVDVEDLLELPTAEQAGKPKELLGLRAAPTPSGRLRLRSSGARSANRNLESMYTCTTALSASSTTPLVK